MRKVTACLMIWCLFLQLWGLAADRAAYAEPNKANADTQNLLNDLFGNPNQDQKQGPAAGQKPDTSKAGGQAAAKPSPKPKESRRAVEKDYATAQDEWRAQGVADSSGFKAEIHPRDFTVNGTAVNLTTVQDAQGYAEPVFNWKDDVSEVRFHVNVPKEGLYRIKIDYFFVSDSIVPMERGVMINGQFPYFEARRILLAKNWKNESNRFEEDGLGNQMFPKQVTVRKWQSAYLNDASYLYDEPLKFQLRQGDNEITLLHLREPMLIGKITVESPVKLLTYEEYKKAKPQNEGKAVSVLHEWEAEFPLEKSDSAVRAEISGDVSVSPYRSGLITLNTMGGDSWKGGGQSVTWKFSVDETGYYQIATKYIQYFKINMPVFRSVQIDGNIPFEELKSYQFPYAPKWKNETLSGPDGKGFLFYLEKGEHTISMVADPAPYEPVVRTIKEVMDQLNVLYLDVKMATGNTQDVYRDWNIAEQMPDLPDQLRQMAGKLRVQVEYLKKLSGMNPDQARNLSIGADQLERLAAEPDKIPVRFEQLAQGSGSISQKLGDLLQILTEQPLQLDKFYVYSNQKLPTANAGMFKRVEAMVVNFFASFTRDYTQISPSDQQSLQVWVNRPRQYVMMMQQLANKSFTKQTGIKVSFGLMPSEQKLILANSSGQSPDVAMSIDPKLPYELSLRGAIADLGAFGGFKQTESRFSPGAMIPFQFDGGVYALPETQNFWVLFYRKDLLDSLKLKVPDTWNDVIDMLPALQRYGMNFYVPLSGAGGSKGLQVTAPFFNQFGAELFAPNGMKAGVDSEQALDAFKLMTKLFTIYNMPLQVPNFYNHFREGSLPIGISDFNTYVELTAAAPELAGWWKIAPYPGIKNANGEVIRWAPGTGRADVIFKSSRKQLEAWEFMKWWTSAETQLEFGTTMETIYGPSYKWNTSNLEAFAQMPWPKDDLQVIGEQWRWLKDIPHVPGDYMLDREVSNAWNKTVFDGVNPRKAIEDAVVLSNREIEKKSEEFGYMRNGQIVKELKVPNVTEPGKGGSAP